jgi:beta-N-acetylglucosaminidase/Glycosyl hydrolase family 20, domain 2
MFIKKLLIIATLLSFFGGGMLNTEVTAQTVKKEVIVLNKKNVAWFNRKVKSKKQGFKTTDNITDFWYTETPTAKDICAFYTKKVNVKAYDYMIFSYKAMPGTFLTAQMIEMEGSKKVQHRRICSFILGDGKWHEIKVPVKRDVVFFGISISERGKAIDGQNATRKVFLKPILGVTQKTLAVKFYKLEEPVIIPSPKKIKRSGRKIILIKDNKSEFAVRLNEKQLALKKIIAKEIADNLKITESSILNVAKQKTVINLEFGKECSIKVPTKKEGYSIKFSKHNKQNIITLAANDKAGLYWAWITLKQLIVKENNTVKINACDISDWPDYQVRGAIAYRIKQEKLGFENKLNFIEYPWWVVRGHMWKLSPKYIKNLKEMCNYAVPRGMDVVQWLGPFYEKKSITVSDDNEIDKLFKLYEISLKTGNRVCYLGIDDGGRLEGSFTPADQKAYKNDRLLSHAWFVKKMSDKIYAKYPDTTIFFCTRNYEYAIGITGYYDRIGVSKNVIPSWTGEQCVTLDYPEHIIKKYEKGIEGRRFRIGDNTPGQMHGMYRGLTICEKYGVGYKYLYKSKKCLGIRASCTPNNQVRLILIKSAAEYAWNASRYNPELARQKAIAKISGSIKAVKPILIFSYNYLKLAYKYPIDKRIRPKKDFILGKGIRAVVGGKKLEEREISKYSIDDEEYKKLSENILIMDVELKQINKECKNKMLTAEFNLFYRNMKEIIAYLRKNSVPAAIINPEGSFAFNMNNVPGGVGYKTRGPRKLMSACLYGNQTANNTFTVVFNLKSLPANKNITLELDGWDCDKHLPLMVIKVNDKKVFAGETTFGHTYPYKTGPGRMNITIPAKYLRAGKNLIKIIDDEPSSDSIDNWLVLAGVKLKF